MPASVRAFAENQPVTSIVTPCATCSPSNRSAATSGSPSAGFGLLVMAYALAMASYRRKLA
nr:hypothetical protein [Solirubrobacter ginsenosidimutans]